MANRLLTIADPGWRSKRTLEAINVSASWEVSTLGVLSAKVPAKRAHILGMGDLKGAWVRCDFGRQGIWGGIVRRNPTETNDGTMELSCDSFHCLLDGIVTPRTYRQTSAPAGALWLRALTDAATDRRLWLDSYRADEDGPALAMEWRGDELYDLSGYLAENSDHEWDVTLNPDWTIAAVFRKRIGRDRRSRVLFVEGWNVISGQVAPAIDELVNEIIAVPEDERWEAEHSATAIDKPSKRLWGRYTQVRPYAAMSGPEILYIKAKQDLRTSAYPVSPATLIVPANVRQLSEVRQGDTVRYWSTRQNKRGSLRIVSRSIDLSDGTVKLAGDFTEDAAA